MKAACFAAPQVNLYTQLFCVDVEAVRMAIINTKQLYIGTASKSLAKV